MGLLMVSGGSDGGYAAEVSAEDQGRVRLSVRVAWFMGGIKDDIAFTEIKMTPGEAKTLAADLIAHAEKGE